MKKIIASLLVLLLLGMANILTPESNEYSIIKNGEYCNINVENLPYIYKEGYPVLPYKYETYVFPSGTEIKEVIVKEKNVEKIKLKEKIEPAPAPYPKKFEIKEGEVYSRDEFYPSSWYEYEVHAGINNGERVIFLSIYLYPFRYNALRNEILHSKDFDLKIDYRIKENKASASLYDFLIISPDEWLSEIEVLKQHKESKGIKTIAVGLNEIYNSPASRKGRDDAEKVKYFIKNAIEEWGIKYVMLVGDGKNFPYRLSYIPSEEYETSFPSDLYFADIYFPNGSFSSWDTNNNDKFGEYKYQGNTDLVDLAPDVYIGRVACSSADDVTNIVNKIINYENSAPEFQDWFRNIIVCGGDTFTPDDGDKSGVYEGEYLNSVVLDKMDDFNEIKLWASLGNLDASSITSYINSGAGFVDFSGHGNKLEWATHPPLDGSKWIEYRNAHVLQTTNKEKLPVVIINACSCGRFDSGDCFAWKFLDHTNGGGIASLASSGIGYGTFGTYSSKGLLGWMEVNFFNYYKEGKKVIGDIWASSINGYISAISKKDDADYKTIEEWALFGDPTLRIGGYIGDEVFVYIDKPLSGYLYMGDNEIMKTFFGRTIVFGGITIESRAYNAEKVEFYIDNELKYIDNSSPYSWKFDETCFGKHEIKIVAYGKETKEAKISVFIFNI